MKYTELTLHQRISLKGYFFTVPELRQYALVMVAFNFVKAVNYFLNDDINELYLRPYKQSGNRESFSDYNQGWYDACDA